ncbi:MAG: serine/threonine-protein kinase [Rubripirellula sp.]|nr:serine/threonine-protein kinase [Rubripirellula sp.]
MHEYTPDEEIDRLCDQFEKELQDGKQPSVESYLRRVDEARRSSLLYWLLNVELHVSREPVTQKQRGLQRLRSKLHRYRQAIDDAGNSLKKPAMKLPKIPGYTIKRHVKQGGQGSVYQAIQNRTGQNVAIKLVSAHQLEQISGDHRTRVISQLETEIRTVAGLNHPNVVKLFDAGESDAGFYFVMQWVKGGSLADHATFNQTEATRIILSIAEALADAHASGILHLDVKPQNILMDQSTGQPLLADFGLARLSQETTKSNAIAGTLGYMAPEQAKGSALDVRADVYGLGATFYYLLTGEKPYSNVTLPYKETQQESWLPKSPRMIQPNVNPTLEHICTKCLSFDPDKRFQNCMEVAAALNRFTLTEDGRRIAQLGVKTLVASPLVFLINLIVAVQLDRGWAFNPGLESLVWVTMFSMYAVVFSVFGSTSRLDKHSPEYLAVESLWATWLAKFFAAITIAGSLRLMLPAEEAILISYPMFSALTGFALATMAPRYYRPLYGFALIAWCNSLLLMWSVDQKIIIPHLGIPAAPVIYGAMATVLTVIWGWKLREFSREALPLGTSRFDMTTVDLPKEIESNHSFVTTEKIL